LRTCARLLKPLGGDVQLGNGCVHKGSHKQFARKLAMLSQGAIPPSGFVVEDLVSSGRRPYQGILRQWRKDDEDAVEGALNRCDLCGLRYREVEMLSGGQRQRAWIAMALAQDTPVLLLDEPTTFLDISAQIDLLDIARSLNHEQGRTVVMILHDLNLAARYADHMIAMKNGEIVASGTPHEVLTEELLRTVFEVEAAVITDTRTGTPLMLPTRSMHASEAIAAEQAAAIAG
jgi:iron complex transport system ATP-binding protein